MEQPVNRHALATNGAFQSHTPINPKTGKRYSNAGLMQAYVLRELAYDMTMALKEAISRKSEPVVTRDEAIAIQNLVKAWDTILNRLRILRRQGLPAVEKRLSRNDSA